MLTFLIFLASITVADPVALPGYDRYEDLWRKAHELGESEWVTASTLGQTRGEREVFLLTLSIGEAKNKPAIVIVGNVHAPHVAGSEYAMLMASQLIERAKTDANVRKLLTDCTIYVIPRPSPDATEKNFSLPIREHVGNARKTDDDRDFSFGEDPPEDLNGDGLITQMRIADDTGEYILHPEDDRLLIKADPKKKERGKYRLITEGIDNDGDEQFNEDPGDGVAFNRNFPFRYQPFAVGAGPHQVSEEETRYVADFIYDHPEIVQIVTFTPDDNLINPWKHDANKDKQPEKRSAQKADVETFNRYSELYKQEVKAEQTPSHYYDRGSFSEWAYFHVGRWSLAARGWSPLYEKVERPEDAPEIKDKRELADQQLLAWLDANKIDGFVKWQAIDHPDFPGKRVEVGGFKPFVRLNPPADHLDAIAEKHVNFLLKAHSLSSRLGFRNTKQTSLGGGVYRIETTVVNFGELPTMTAMGKINTIPYPLQLSIETPEKTTFIQGHARTTLSPIAPHGGKQAHTWLIRTTGDPKFKLRVYSPTVDAVETEVSVEHQQRLMQ